LNKVVGPGIKSNQANGKKRFSDVCIDLKTNLANAFPYVLDVLSSVARAEAARAFKPMSDSSSPWASASEARYKSTLISSTQTSPKMWENFTNC
jgi:hypothetical protein